VCVCVCVCECVRVCVCVCVTVCVCSHVCMCVGIQPATTAGPGAALLPAPWLQSVPGSSAHCLSPTARHKSDGDVQSECLSGSTATACAGVGQPANAAGGVPPTSPTGGAPVRWRGKYIQISYVCACVSVSMYVCVCVSVYDCMHMCVWVRVKKREKGSLERMQCA
jgi:hypothetical protein